MGTTSCPSCQAPVAEGASQCDRCGYILAVEVKDPLLGQEVGNLVLTSRLGSGGMGAVYRAEHRSLRTPYAVKVLHPQYSNHPATAERFRREAVTCSQLRHENVVFVTDFGIKDQLGIYIVMEYLEGSSLTQILHGGTRFGAGRLLRIGEQITSAMAAAHRLNIVHRDLKPDNIMIMHDKSRRDFVKVLDFGIAHIRGEGAQQQLTQAGMAMGTPTYMSPEQITSKPGSVGPSTDIYSLGVIFYEVLTGAPPFVGDSEFDLLRQHMMSPPAPLSGPRPELEGTLLSALIHQMLEKQPEKRPASMDELNQRLGEAVRELQERGMEDAFYKEPSGATFIPSPSSASLSGPNQATRSSQTMHLTDLVRRIRAEAPGSAAAALLNALPGADSLKGEALSLAIWGVLQEELLEAPMDSDRYVMAQTQLCMLLDAVLTAHKGDKPTDSQMKVFRSLRNLLVLAPPERQKKLLEVLQPQLGHPLVPADVIPKGAAPPAQSGAWRSLRAVMTKEIKIPWSEPKPSGEPPASPPQPKPEPKPEPKVEANPQAKPDKESAEAGSLVDKLKAPVSAGALKSLLSHEIRLFGKKDKK